MVQSSLAASALFRGSPLAVYLRQCRLAFIRMSQEELVYWWENAVAWCDAGLDRAGAPTGVFTRCAVRHWPGD